MVSLPEATPLKQTDIPPEPLTILAPQLGVGMFELLPPSARMLTRLVFRVSFDSRSCAHGVVERKAGISMSAFD